MEKINQLDKKELEKIPLIYLYLYKKICERTLRFKIIPYRILLSVFKQTLHRIPRKYYDIIIKELIDFNLMEKVGSGKSPTYKISPEDHKKRQEELKKIEKSGLRFIILKDKYEKLIKEIEQINNLDKKYTLLKCDYEKILRKLELKKLEGSHYW